MAFATLQLETVIKRRDLDALLKAVEPAVVLGVIAVNLVDFVTKSFNTRGRGKWRPLAASTLALRQRGGDVPLQDTGQYKQSFTGQVSRQPLTPAPETDNRTYVEVGSNKKTPSGIPLAAIHEEGTKPYTIKVKQARVLAAKTRAGTWLIFGREVHHPGISARPVLPTVPEAEARLKPVLEGMLRRASDGGD